MIRQIAHACYTVKDLQRAIDFYCGVLGMQEAFDFVDKEGQRFGVYLHAGNACFIELFMADVPEAGGGSYRHLCLLVDDLAAARRTLAAQDVDVSEAKMGTDASWQAWIEDPDGNRIELHQYTGDSLQTKYLETGRKLRECAGS